MSNPKISIIIPVYNVEKYLHQCLESILAQTFKNFEVILVNDGSTDKSPSICDSYASRDSRIHVIHQRNEGVSKARNKGMDYAHGEWISFIDSDDWVEFDYLEKFNFDTNDADFIIQGLEYYDSREERFFKQVRVNNCDISGSDIKQIVSENNLLGLGYPVAKAYKKTLIDRGIRFNTFISYHEDHIFVFDVLAVSEKIRLVDSVAYKYRYYHSGSSLSSMHHSWRKLNIASDGMIKAINRLHDRFLQTGSTYERQVYNLAYHPKISAVFELFQFPESTYNKKKALNTIIKPDELQSYYNPYALKDKLVKYVLYFLPYLFQQLFFSLYIKYQKKKNANNIHF